MKYGAGREALLKAVVDVVAEEGLDGLSYKKVAERAGVNNTLIFHNSALAAVNRRVPALMPSGHGCPCCANWKPLKTRTFGGNRRSGIPYRRPSFRHWPIKSSAMVALYPQFRFAAGHQEWRASIGCLPFLFSGLAQLVSVTVEN